MNSALLRRKSLKDDALAVMRAAVSRWVHVRARGPLRGRAWNCVENVETRSLAHQTKKETHMKGNEGRIMDGTRP